MLYNGSKVAKDAKDAVEKKKKITKRQAAQLVGAAAIGAGTAIAVQKVRANRKQRHNAPASNWENDSWSKQEGVSATGKDKK